MNTSNSEANRGELVSKLTCILVLVGTLLVLLTGCVDERESPSFLTTDQGLLTDKPCAPPCWYGVVPGVTSEDDLQAILKASSHTLVYTGTALTGIDTCPEVMDYGIKTSEGARVFVDLHDGIVRMIKFSIEPELTLEEIIEHFGPPEALDVHLTGEEVPILSVTMWYPSKGFQIGGWRSRGFGERWVAPQDGLYTVQLNENMKVSRVVYYATSDTMDEALRSILCQSERDVAEALMQLREWEAFGEMQVSRH